MSRRNLFLILTLALGTAVAGETTLTIDVDKPGVKVSPTLYGIFFEEINRAGDGGLYAEMVQNRSFEDADKPIGWSGGTLDKSRPLNANNPTSLRIEGSVTNKCFQMAKQGQEYRLSLYARGKGELGIEFAGAQRTLTGLGEAWKKFETTLAPTHTDTNAQLVITGKAWLDMVSLFPADAVAGLFRRDLFEKLQAMQPAFVRFPGGCFVEGDRLENAVRWKKTIGDMAERPGHWNLWGYRSTDGLGYHEYLLLCEALGAEPLFVINAGMSHVEQKEQKGPPAAEFVQDALDAIEYANGPVSSRWGVLRAKAGHPAPFNLKFMEIGNENGGPLYHERYAAFYDAIKATHPEMTLIADDWQGLPKNRPLDMIDSHAYTNPEQMRKMATRYDKADRAGPKVYFGEYAVTEQAGRGNLQAAVAEAAFLTGLERNSDLVVMSSYAPLFEHVGYKRWNPNAILFDVARAYATPSWHVQTMFSRNRADVILPVAMNDATNLFVVAGKKDAALILKVINAGNTPQPVKINVRGAQPVASSARAVVLTSANATDENSFEAPAKVAPKEEAITGIGASFQHEFPANSVTVLRIGESVTAGTPPMGWNSYDCFGTSVTEDEVLANAHSMKENLRPHGWEYIVIDARWYDSVSSYDDRDFNKERAGAKLFADEFGRLLPATNRFPSGFTKLAEQLHGMGLKFGLHMMRGIPRQAVNAGTRIEGSQFTAADAGDPKNICSWCPDMFGVRDNAAGQAWYDAVFRLAAAWGLDFVKVDDLSKPYSAHEIAMIRRAIDKCGRKIVFSTSPGPAPVEQGEHLKAHANMWRISGDFWDRWGDLNHAFDLLAQWQGVAGPGHWPDVDMIPLGHIGIKCTIAGGDRQTRFTKNEQVTLMTLWALAPSPLMLGMNLPDLDEWTLSLLTNDEVLAVNQDPLGKPATRVSQQDGVEIWRKELQDGSVAMGFFNRSEKPVAVKLPAGRDLWRRQDVDETEDALQPHAAILLKVKL